MSKEIDLSLVIPCYNEASHLAACFTRILWVLSHLNINYEIIIIDDCSKDNTREVILSLSARCRKLNLRTIFHNANVGRGGTVAEGIKIARGKVVGFLDVDLEISELYLPAFYWKIIEGADMAIAHRHYDFTPSKLMRYLASRGYSWLIKILLQCPFADTEAGYKFFNRRAIRKIIPSIRDKHWFWDTEIVLKSHTAGLKIAVIPVVFERNPAKKSTVKLIPDTIAYLKNIIKFRRETL